MTAVISEISNFDYFLNILKTDMKVSFESLNGILESYLVVLNNFLKSLRLSQSEISDFDHFLNILKTDMKVSFESQNGILVSYLVVLNDF